MNKKARIIKYYQVVDENGTGIGDAHTYKQALQIKKEHENA